MGRERAFSFAYNIASVVIALSATAPLFANGQSLEKVCAGILEAARFEIDTSAGINEMTAPDLAVDAAIANAPEGLHLLSLRNSLQRAVETLNGKEDPENLALFEKTQEIIAKLGSLDPNSLKWHLLSIGFDKLNLSREMGDYTSTGPTRNMIASDINKIDKLLGGRGIDVPEIIGKAAERNLLPEIDIGADSFDKRSHVLGAMFSAAAHKDKKGSIELFQKVESRLQELRRRGDEKTIAELVTLVDMVRDPRSKDKIYDTNTLLTYFQNFAETGATARPLLSPASVSEVALNNVLTRQEVDIDLIEAALRSLDRLEQLNPTLAEQLRGSLLKLPIERDRLGNSLATQEVEDILKFTLEKLDSGTPSNELFAQELVKSPGAWALMPDASDHSIQKMKIPTAQKVKIIDFINEHGSDIDRADRLSYIDFALSPKNKENFLNLINKGKADATTYSHLMKRKEIKADSYDLEAFANQRSNRKKQLVDPLIANAGKKLIAPLKSVAPKKMDLNGLKRIFGALSAKVKFENKIPELLKKLENLPPNDPRWDWIDLISADNRSDASRAFNHISQLFSEPNLDKTDLFLDIASVTPRNAEPTGGRDDYPSIVMNLIEENIIARIADPETYGETHNSIARVAVKLKRLFSEKLNDQEFFEGLNEYLKNAKESETEYHQINAATKKEIDRWFQSRTEDASPLSLARSLDIKRYPPTKKEKELMDHFDRIGAANKDSSMTGNSFLMAVRELEEQEPTLAQVLIKNPSTNQRYPVLNTLGGVDSESYNKQHSFLSEFMRRLENKDIEYLKRVAETDSFFAHSAFNNHPIHKLENPELKEQILDWVKTYWSKFNMDDHQVEGLNGNGVQGQANLLRRLLAPKSKEREYFLTLADRYMLDRSTMATIKDGRKLSFSSYDWKSNFKDLNSIYPGIEGRSFEMLTILGGKLTPEEAIRYGHRISLLGKHSRSGAEPLKSDVQHDLARLNFLSEMSGEDIGAVAKVVKDFGSGKIVQLPEEGAITMAHSRERAILDSHNFTNQELVLGAFRRLANTNMDKYLRVLARLEELIATDNVRGPSEESLRQQVFSKLESELTNPSVAESPTRWATEILAGFRRSPL